MARGTSSEGMNYVFMKPFRGWITEKVNPNIPNQQIEDFDVEIGDEVKTFTKAVNPNISGKITGVEIHKGNYGPELRIFMVDGPESYCIQMKADSSEAIDFYNKMMAIDYNEEVQIYHWLPKDENSKPKKYYKLGVSQKNKEGEWDKIGYSFKKDEAPSWEKGPLGGWDKTPAIKFYLDALKKLQVNLAMDGNTPKKKEEATVESDDLPF